jgi:hypothetical protein
MFKNINKYIVLILLSTLMLIPVIGSNAQINFNDEDKDLLTNNLESIIGTDPQLFDTDGDGYGDGYEYYYKVNGGAPLDPTKHPRELTPEEDKDGDGYVDFSFDPSVTISLQIGTAISDVNLGTSSCNLSEVDKSNSQFESLDCKYKLIGDPNNDYYLAFQTIAAHLETSPDKTSADCIIINNKTADAQLLCSSIPYEFAEQKEQKVIVTKYDFNSTNPTYNQSQLITVTNTGEKLGILPFSLAIDSALPRDCEVSDSGFSASCKFQLPEYTELPINYQLGIGTAPGGECNSDSTGKVECVNVPTAINARSGLIFSAFNQETPNALKQEVALKKASIQDIPIYDLTIDVAKLFPDISGINVSYNGPAIMIFKGDTTQFRGVIENGIFKPINPINFPRFQENSSIEATLIPENQNDKSQDTIAKFNIKTIKTITSYFENQSTPNTSSSSSKPTTVVATLKKDLARTGGSMAIVPTLVLLMMVLNYLIFKKLTPKNK